MIPADTHDHSASESRMDDLLHAPSWIKYIHTQKQKYRQYGKAYMCMTHTHTCPIYIHYITWHDITLHYITLHYITYIHLLNIRTCIYNLYIYIYCIYKHRVIYEYICVYYMYVQITWVYMYIYILHACIWYSSSGDSPPSHWGCF